MQPVGKNHRKNPAACATRGETGLADLPSMKGDRP
jgi:hypothetical protein